MTYYLIWALTITLTIIGILGVIIPLLPGTTLILLAMVLHKILLPLDLTWTAIAFITLVWFLSLVIDFGGTALGARLFGGSKWGMAGATGGAMIGMFFSLPALLIGTILGAATAEKFCAQKSGITAVKSGIGAAIGFLISTIGRLICALIMLIIFLFSALSTAADKLPSP